MCSASCSSAMRVASPSIISPSSTLLFADRPGMLVCTPFLPRPSGERRCLYFLHPKPAHAPKPTTTATVSRNREKITAATMDNTLAMYATSRASGLLNVFCSKGIIVTDARAGHCHINGLSGQVPRKQADKVVFKTAQIGTAAQTDPRDI